MELDCRLSATLSRIAFCLLDAELYRSERVVVLQVCLWSASWNIGFSHNQRASHMMTSLFCEQMPRAGSPSPPDDLLETEEAFRHCKPQGWTRIDLSSHSFIVGDSLAYKSSSSSSSQPNVSYIEVCSGFEPAMTRSILWATL